MPDENLREQIDELRRRAEAMGYDRTMQESRPAPIINMAISSDELYRLRSRANENEQFTSERLNRFRTILEEADEAFLKKKFDIDAMTKLQKEVHIRQNHLAAILHENKAAENEAFILFFRLYEMNKKLNSHIECELMKKQMKKQKEPEPDKWDQI